MRLNDEQKNLVLELVALEVGFSKFPPNAEDDPELGSSWHSYSNEIYDIELKLGLREPND